MEVFVDIGFLIMAGVISLLPTHRRAIPSTLDCFCADHPVMAFFLIPCAMVICAWVIIATLWFTGILG